MSHDPQPISNSAPFIIGHRGSSARAPENTLAAFERALGEGADGVEFDVRLAADGVPVVIHDATLKRTALRDGRVASLTSSELKRLDAGAWFNLRFPEKAHAAFSAEGVPTLAETLELIGSRAPAIYIELKSESPNEHAPLAAAVVAQARARGLVERAVVKCFAHDALREVKRIAPEIRVAALFDRSPARPHITKRAIIKQAQACGADEISLHHSLASRACIDEARRQGFATVVWTVDDPAWLKRAREWGIRAVITNDPARMRLALEETRS